MFTPNHLTPLELLKRTARMGTDADRQKPLTRRQQADVIETLGRLQASDPHLTDRVVARTILRCGRATWSQIRRSIYRGDAEKYLRNARDWMAEAADRRETPATPYVSTSIGRMILKVCRRAVEMPTMGLVMTPSGAGKTAALMEFARQRGDRAMYLAAGAAASNLGGLVAEVADRLRIRLTARSTTAVLSRQIRQKLAAYYGGGVAAPFALLVDEATTLRPAALNWLRNLHDDPAVRAAVVLADTWRLDAELHGRHGLAGGYEQLRSRFGAVYHVRDADNTEGLSSAEAKRRARAIRADDVRTIAAATLAALGAKTRPDAAAVKFLAGLARRPGMFRNVVQRLWAVRDVAADHGSRAEYSAEQLDFVAPIVGAESRLDHAVIPFGKPAGRAATPRQARAAG